MFWALPLGSPLGTPVADGDVEEAVESEVKLAATVDNGLGGEDLGDDPPGQGIRDVRVHGRALELLDPKVELLLRNRRVPRVGIEQAARRVIGGNAIEKRPQALHPAYTSGMLRNGVD